MSETASILNRTGRHAHHPDGEPKSTQNIYRNTCRGGFSSTYMTAEGKAIKEGCQWEAKSQWKGAPPLTGDISLLIPLYFGTKRR